MAFFHGQDTLTSTEWILRAVLTYFIMVMIAKFMGQRAISQLHLLDFVVALMLGNIIAHPLSDSTIGMKGSILTTVVIAILYILSIMLNLKWSGFRKLTGSVPFPLIKNGEIFFSSLKKARISIDYLLAELRKEKVEDIKKVALALWESDGKISIFLDPKYEALTPSTFQKKIEPFDLPRVIIKDGHIILEELREINEGKEWLIETLKNQFKTEVKDVLLATMDQKKALNIFLYKSN